MELSSKSKDKAAVGRDPPVIVFINSKSGGQQGARVKKKFLSILPGNQVFDLSEGGPEPGLKQWHDARKRLRVVACGGDGTAVCVLPLGTGNDLSRILRWGKGYAGEDLYDYVKQVEESSGILPFDRWQVKYIALSDEEAARLIEERKKGIESESEEDEGVSIPGNSNGKKGENFLKRSASVKLEKSLKSSGSKSEGGVPDKDKKGEKRSEASSGDEHKNGQGKGKDKDSDSYEKEDKNKPKEAGGDRSKLTQIVMNNYFSIGIDSQVCLDFHNLRESHPGLFRHKFINFGWYGMLATKSAFNSWQYLKKAIVVKVDGKKIHISKNVMAVVILNIPSYAGGTDLWGKSPKSYSPQSICDGLFEVVGIRGVNHMGMMQSGLSAGGMHIAQGKKVEIQMLYSLPVQVDGEPWIWPASNITVNWHNTANMLFNTKRDKTGKKQKKLLEGRGAGESDKFEKREMKDI